MSHHISGPRAIAEPVADITDLYAFPSPEHSGRLVLVLNTLPFAPPSVTVMPPVEHVSASWICVGSLTPGAAWRTQHLAGRRRPRSRHHHP